jgi:hypothetical protein
MLFATATTTTNFAVFQKQLLSNNITMKEDKTLQRVLQLDLPNSQHFLYELDVLQKIKKP